MGVITVGNLMALGATEKRAERYVDHLNRWMTLFAIDTPLRQAHFLAQVMHESQGLLADEENMNYSAAGLMRVFKKYFTADSAKLYERQPEKIANRVYAKRMGNGNTESGDGWRFRGRGLIMVTGRENYAAFAKWVGEPRLATTPEMLTRPEYAAASAVWYWNDKALNHYADADDIEKITRKINGGANGIVERMELLRTAKRILNTGQGD